MGVRVQGLLFSSVLISNSFTPTAHVMCMCEQEANCALLALHTHTHILMDSLTLADKEQKKKAKTKRQSPLGITDAATKTPPNYDFTDYHFECYIVGYTGCTG